MVNENEQSNFSDDIGYLATISNLINKSHEASADSDQDVYDWFNILEQLQIEVEGQLWVKKKLKTINSLDEMRLNVKKNLAVIYTKYGSSVGNLSPTDAGKLRDVVFPYHRLLNRVIHSEQLRMKNFVVDGFESSFSRNNNNRG